MGLNWRRVVGRQLCTHHSQHIILRRLRREGYIVRHIRCRTCTVKCMSGERLGARHQETDLCDPCRSSKEPRLSTPRYPGPPECPQISHLALVTSSISFHLSLALHCIFNINPYYSISSLEFLVTVVLSKVYTDIGIYWSPTAKMKGIQVSQYVKVRPQPCCAPM